MKIPRADFERLAERALEELPEWVKGLLYNLEIAVKAFPGTEAGRFRGRRSVLGLYTGLTREQMLSTQSGSYLPPRIILYQRNIEPLCSDEAALFEQIRLTLRHEIAHHLGMSDEDLREKWPEGA